MGSCCSSDAADDGAAADARGALRENSTSSSIALNVGTFADFESAFDLPPAALAKVCGQGGFCKVVIAQARQAAGTGTGTTLADRPISSGSSDLSRPLLDAEDPSGNGVIENAPQTYQDALERPAKGASVAVKIFKTAFKATSELFYHEVAVLTRLRRAYFAKLANGVGATFGGNYVVEFYGAYHNPRARQDLLVIEYCAGGELFDRIVQHDFFSEAVAAHYLKMTARSLLFCHSNGVLHGDIKPENFVFLSEHPQAPLKLIDFGLAVVDGVISTAGGRSARKIVGTPEYLAPETVTSRLYQFSNDVWALGVLLYIMLAGTFPFYGKTKLLLYNQIKAGVFKTKGCPWDTMSDECLDLLHKMLTVDHTKRPTLQQVLLHPWLHHRRASGDKPLPKEARHKLRQFQLRSKFRAAVRTVTVGGSLFRRARTLSAQRSSSSSSPKSPILLEDDGDSHCSSGFHGASKDSNDDTASGESSLNSSPSPPSQKITCAAGFDKASCRNPLHVHQVQSELANLLPGEFSQDNLMTIFKSLWEHVVDNNDATIDMTKFTKAMENCRQSCNDPAVAGDTSAAPCVFSERAVAQLYDLLDTDGDGLITAEEIVTMLSHCTQARRSHLEFCFRLFDRNNSGYLEADEFALMIRTMRKNAGVDSARAVSHDEQSAPVVAGGNLQADPTELFTDPFHEALAIALHDFKISPCAGCTPECTVEHCAATCDECPSGPGATKCGTGRLSFEEFCSSFDRHPEIYDMLLPPEQRGKSRSTASMSVAAVAAAAAVADEAAAASAAAQKTEVATGNAR